MKVDIIDDWYDTIKSLPAFDLLSGHQVTVWTSKAKNEYELADRLEGSDIVVLYRDRTKITSSLAKMLKGVSLITMRGQHNHVDTEALKAEGITFFSKPALDGPSIPTAELTIGLIISALRYLPDQITSARTGQWQGGAPVGRNVSGKTLGLYGYGGISKIVARYASTLGMAIIVWGSSEGRRRASEDGLNVANSRYEFFSSSNVVTIHKRLTDKTKAEISKKDLLDMNAGSVLINTSRAGLIETGAVLSALEGGRLDRVCLDVFDDEPITSSFDDLISHPSVIPTPHIGFVTEEELNKQFGEIFEVINNFAIDCSK